MAIPLALPVFVHHCNWTNNQLSELIGDPKTATWILPANIPASAHDPATPALDTALICNLHLPGCIGLVYTCWTKVQAGFFITLDAHFLGNYVQVGFMFVNIVFERH